MSALTYQPTQLLSSITLWQFDWFISILYSMYIYSIYIQYINCRVYSIDCILLTARTQVHSFYSVITRNAFQSVLSCSSLSFTKFLYTICISARWLSSVYCPHRVLAEVKAFSPVNCGFILLWCGVLFTMPASACQTQLVETGEMFMNSECTQTCIHPHTHTHTSRLKHKDKSRSLFWVFFVDEDCHGETPCPKVYMQHTHAQWPSISPFGRLFYPTVYSELG